MIDTEEQNLKSSIVTIAVSCLCLASIGYYVVNTFDDSEIVAPPVNFKSKVTELSAAQLNVTTPSTTIVDRLPPPTRSLFAYDDE